MCDLPQSTIRGLALGLVGLALWMPAMAQESQQTARQATDTQPTQSEATRSEAADRALAAQWDLSMPEWDRYQTLRQSIDGYLSDKLDPITLLGMNARSQAEQRRYAERLARLMHDHTERVLAFQKAYDSAFTRLYPNEKPLRTDDFGRALADSRQDAAQLGLDGGARKAVFVDTNDCPRCVATVKRLASTRTPMDIFVVDAAGDDEAIRRWARRVGVDAARVRSGDITLNHAPPAAAEQLNAQSLPRVIDRR